ncbi:tol-pal system YbgF family protein [Streptomyces niveus]|uniref:tetratricopeptide repeat protein n=1 Tax=Streptomyces niveus TaxID=193462 RepID=UPI003657F331
MLPVIAWYENHADELGDAGFRSPQVRELVDTALADAALADPDHPRLPEVLHLLAYFLYRQGRYKAAREQFRQVDGFTEALPWLYSFVKPLYYRAVRTKTARKALTERRPG